MTNFAAIDFETAVRLSVSLGGDSDTLACITGGIAEAYYQEIPEVSEKRKNKYFPFLFRKIKKQ